MARASARGQRIGQETAGDRALVVADRVRALVLPALGLPVPPT